MKRGGYRTAATSKMELFVIIVNGWKVAGNLGCCSSPRSASEKSSQPLTSGSSSASGSTVASKFKC